MKTAHEIADALINQNIGWQAACMLKSQAAEIESLTKEVEKLREALRVVSMDKRLAELIDAFDDYDGPGASGDMKGKFK